MRKIKLQILLSLASLLFPLLVAAQRPHHPDPKRRGRASTTVDKPNRWSGERKKENLKRPPERASAEKKSTTREERPGGRSKTRDKAGAWDRSQQKDSARRSTDSKTLESKLTERDRKSASRRQVDKARQWERRPKIESKSAQQAKLRDHLFRGWINSMGMPVGYHHEGKQGKPPDGVTIVSRRKADAHGVYEAKLRAGAVEKARHTFFPLSWSRAQVEKAINEAHAVRKREGDKPSYYVGQSSSGVRIGMHCRNDGSIITAFPIYQK